MSALQTFLAVEIEWFRGKAIHLGDSHLKKRHLFSYKIAFRALLTHVVEKTPMWRWAWLLLISGWECPVFQTCWYLAKKYVWRALNLKSICFDIDEPETRCVSDMFCFKVAEWRFIMLLKTRLSLYAITWLTYSISIMCVCVRLCLQQNMCIYRTWLFTNQGHFKSLQQRPWQFDLVARFIGERTHRSRKPCNEWLLRLEAETLKQWKRLMLENTGMFNPRVVLNWFGGCLNGDFLKTRMFSGEWEMIWQSFCPPMSPGCLDRVCWSFMSLKSFHVNWFLFCMDHVKWFNSWVLKWACVGSFLMPSPKLKDIKESQQSILQSNSRSFIHPWPMTLYSYWRKDCHSPFFATCDHKTRHD